MQSEAGPRGRGGAATPSGLAFASRAVLVAPYLAPKWVTHRRRNRPHSGAPDKGEYKGEFFHKVRKRVSRRLSITHERVGGAYRITGNSSSSPISPARELRKRGRANFHARLIFGHLGQIPRTEKKEESQEKRISITSMPIAAKRRIGSIKQIKGA